MPRFYLVLLKCQQNLGTSSAYRNDTIGWDSGVRPIVVRGVEPRRWMRDERTRAEKAR